MRPGRLAHRLTTSLWFIPVVCVLLGVMVSLGSIWIDSTFDFELVPQRLTGGPDAAVAIFSTIAASMVSLAALVLTITMVVVQLAMGQFSPRIVQTFLRDKPSQIAVGLFIATFVHAMIALREASSATGVRCRGSQSWSLTYSWSSAWSSSCSTCTTSADRCAFRH